MLIKSINQKLSFQELYIKSYYFGYKDYFIVFEIINPAIAIILAIIIILFVNTNLKIIYKKLFIISY